MWEIMYWHIIYYNETLKNNDNFVEVVKFDKLSKKLEKNAAIKIEFRLSIYVDEKRLTVKLSH